ncbi:LysR family transcriptional regulator [Halomonas organivorans]|uniref:DNA-binding transcriptional LysR family regulator n=1 Tax=Halomonas organivorans TaxID=257772 RepID=A0A7W5G697_9GAMM|nr:LysR family transcriptional regulator [Halomonas organivorans]MBB3141920.1 DNA-binding transcriptional LysR family regulator [Halomonas organivorans]
MMPFSLEQLRTFGEVARHGSFSAAARRLGKTQSAVSMAIANLEVDLAVTLFDRTSRAPRLTPEGESLLLDAELILARCQDLEAHANSLGDRHPPRLTLAVEIPYASIIRALEAFEAAYPHVDLEIRNPIHGDVSEQMASGDIDFGIAFSQPSYPETVAFTQLGKLVMAHVCHRDHPLAHLDPVGFTALRSHRHLVFSSHDNTLPSSEYLKATKTWKAESYFALIEMAKHGLGWATLPRQLVRRELEEGILVELPLAAYPHTDWLVGVDLLWNKQKPSGEVEAWLRRRLTENAIFEYDSRGNKTTF